MTPVPVKVNPSRGWLYACIALLVFSLTYVSLPQFFRELELRLYDYRLRASSKAQSAKEIVLVDIDDKSVKALAGEGAWPWNRKLHAVLMDVLTQCDVGLIAFDIVFHGQGTSDEEENIRFSDALARNGKVVLAAGFQLAQEEELIMLELDEDDRALKESFLNIEVADMGRLFQAERSFVPLSLFSKSTRGVGHISARCDSDGVFRRVPLLIGFNGEILPSIDLLAIMEYLHAGKIEWLEGEGLRLTEVKSPHNQKRTITIPTDDKGCMLVNYSGTWGEAFRHISFHEIYYSYHNPSEIERFREILSGKLVIIALATSGSTDIGPTPHKASEPLSTVHSNAMNTILTGAFLKEAPVVVQILLGCLMVVIIILVSMRLSPLFFSIAFLILMFGYITSNLFLFSHYHIVMNLSGITLASMVAFVVLLIHGYMTTARESALQKDVLRAYFSPKIIDQIMRSPDVFSLEGSGQEVTILFSDIVGFTNLSDNLHPAAVQYTLSTYLEAMTDVIFRHNGAVDKFMGDGIMAFWGYPEPEDTDAVENLRLSASDAVKAAVEMQRKMRELNDKWAREARKTLQIRIGVNTGYVTLGNMGSRHRLEFTLIGKNVNLAQRLEGAAPGGGILISDRTYSLVKDEVKAKKMRGLTLSGFGEEVHAYLVEL